MANYNSSAHVHEGVETRSKFNLSHDVITTSDFNQLNVISIKELVPGDSFNTKVNSFCRLAPMPVPTYGRANMVTRHFYVPLRLLMKGFENFLTNTTYQTTSAVVTPAVPTITNKALFEMFTTAQHGLMIVTTSAAYQWNDGTNSYAFTFIGRKLYSLLVSLGYQINPTSSDVTKMSLLPILAYGRIYFDWYFPSQYQPTNPLRYYFEQSNLAITTATAAWQLFDNIPIFGKLEKDYFTSAWLTPNSPIGEKILTMQNVAYGTSSTKLNQIVSSDLGNKGAYLSLTIPSGASNVSISQYGLDTLHAVDHYMRRNMIAGNRYIEQMMARYGKKVPDAWIQRSEYLGSVHNPIMISDVMSTADTSSASSGAALGDFAGKGIGQVDGRFNYDSQEFGYLITINQIIPHTGYVQGRRRETVFHIELFDFFTPEMELVGTAPIRNDELFAQFRDAQDYTQSQSSGGKPDGIFGFQDRYSEYRNSFDILSGDFINRGVNSGMTSWHLFRDLNPTDESLALNLAFMDGNPSTNFNWFNRIFQTTSNTADHFIMVHNITHEAYRPMHSSADTILTEGGKYIEMPKNGYQL